MVKKVMEMDMLMLFKRMALENPKAMDMVLLKSRKAMVLLLKSRKAMVLLLKNQLNVVIMKKMIGMNQKIIFHLAIYSHWKLMKIRLI